MKSSLRRRGWLYGMSLLPHLPPARPPTVTHRNSSLLPRGTPSSLRTQRTTPRTMARSQPTVGEEPVSQSGGCCCLLRSLTGARHTIPRPPPKPHPHIRGHQAISFPCTSLYGLVMNFVGSHTLAPYVSRLFRWEPVWVSPYKSITCKCWLMLISAD